MFWRRKRREAELERELRGHLDLEAAEQRERGLSEHEARFAARRALGNTARLQEDVRQAWGWETAARFGRDVRYALRSLRANPGFTTVAVLALALGIGSNTAIYSIIRAVYLRMLPVERPEELVAITTPFVARGEARVNESFSYPFYVHLRDGGRTLAGLLAHHPMDMSVSARGTTDRARGALVSGNYFAVLGVRPVAGTAIEPADDATPRSGGARGPIAVLSYGYWIDRFGGDYSAIGSTIGLNGQPFVVAGVAPPGFNGTVVGQKVDVFAPLMTEPVLWPENPNALTGRRNVWLRLMGRVRPEAGEQATAAELTVLLKQFNQVDLAQGGLSESRRQALQTQTVGLMPASAGTSSLPRQFRTMLSVVAAVAGLVLLIACANVANLLLTRAHGRRREIAVRLALGASRGRLLSHLMTESLALALLGSAAAILLGSLVRGLMVGLLPRLATVDTSFDWNVLGFNLALGGATGILFGLIPALQAGKTDLARGIKAGGAADGRRRFDPGKGLVVFQVALSLMLLTGASIFIRTLSHLEAIDAGIVHRSILTFAADPRLAGYDDERGKAFLARLVERSRALPGVISAAQADFSPLGNHTGRDLFIEGFLPGADEPSASPSFGAVGPGYFETLGIPILLGRGFEPRDSSGPRVAIVNETFARHYFGGRSPIGRRIGFEKNRHDTEIVGVVKDGKYANLREGATRMVYVPAAQTGGFFQALVIHLRTAGEPAALASAVRGVVRELDANVPVSHILTLEQHFDEALAQEKLIATLCSVFSALALGLSAVGLYGVMSYRVSRRVREIGIRMAIGATRGGILRQVMGEALRLVAGGMLLGLPLSYGVLRLVESMLYGVKPADAVSAAVAMSVLAAATLIAAWLPAGRAARIEPMRALREE
jgi:predicted permease